MKAEVLLKCLSHRGEIVNIKEFFDFPDFEPIPPKTIKGYLFPETTVHSQLVDYLDEIDKREFMDKNDVQIILDFWFVEDEKEKLLMEVLKSPGLNISEGMLNDMIAVYSEIKELIEDKNVEEQIMLILSHVRVGYMASTETNRQILAILRNDEPLTPVGKHRKNMLEQNNENHNKI